MKQTLKKQERLKSSRVIRLLYEKGHTFLVHPYKVNWMVGSRESRYPARALFGVSRKNFRKATERNHLKRLCREAYRKNKHILYDYLDSRNLECNLSLIYVGKSTMEFSMIEKKIIGLLKRLVSDIDNHSRKNKQYPTDENI